MILIISQHIEESTNQVIAWLHFYNADYRRLNGKELTAGSAGMRRFMQLFNDAKNSVNAVWYRRWNFETVHDYRVSDDEQLQPAAIEHIKKELHVLKGAFWLSLQDKFWLNHPDTSNSDRFNKIYVLEAAKEESLLVPAWSIESTKLGLLSFMQKTGRVITKCLSDSGSFTVAGKTFGHYTHLLQKEDFTHIPDQFFPGFFQQHIPKLFDVRVFYLDGKFFSMAIFSQQHEQTATDFRRYHATRPNRTVPYELSRETEWKLRRLFRKLNLNCGSVDIIHGLNGQDYFLELNPLGQFGMVSHPCNYHIEHKIARLLIEKDQFQ